MKNRIIGLCAILFVTAGFVGCASDDAQKTVFNIRAGYNVALSAAVNYESLPRCVEGGTKVCSDTKAVEEIRKADLQAKNALDYAENFVRTHGDLDASSAIDAAQGALDVFTQILTAYNIEVK